MSHENSIATMQRELSSEYGRYLKSNSDKGFFKFLVKGLIIPLFVLLIILTGASFIIANYSPAMYTQAKDIIFEQVDFVKLTGQTDVVNKEILDSWLVLNPENRQMEQIVPGAMVLEEQTESQPN